MKVISSVGPPAQRARSRRTTGTPTTSFSPPIYPAELRRRTAMTPWAVGSKSVAEPARRRYVYLGPNVALEYDASNALTTSYVTGFGAGDVSAPDCWRSHLVLSSGWRRQHRCVDQPGRCSHGKVCVRGVRPADGHYGRRLFICRSAVRCRDGPVLRQPCSTRLSGVDFKLFGDAAVAVLLPLGDKVVAAAVADADPARAEALRRRLPIPLSREFMNSRAIIDRVIIDVPDVDDPPADLASGAKNFRAADSAPSRSCP